MVKSQVKILSSKYSQKIVGHAKKSATDALKTASKRAIKKTEESTGYLIGNKIADKIGRVSKTSPQNNSETNEEEILRERYVSPDLRHKIIQHPRLKTEKYWETNINRIIYNNEMSKNNLYDTTNQPSKFTTRNWVETNDESRGTYNNIKFKMLTVRSNLCGYSDANMQVQT